MGANTVCFRCMQGLLQVHIKAGLWKYHARLVRLVHFHSGQVENFYLLVLGPEQGQVQDLHCLLESWDLVIYCFRKSKLFKHRKV